MAKPAGRRGHRRGRGALWAFVLIFATGAAASASSQQSRTANPSLQRAASFPYASHSAHAQISAPLNVGSDGATLPKWETSEDSLSQWEGWTVRSISFEGVAAARLGALAGHLAQAEGAPLNREELKKSLRQLFATGLYESIEVAGLRQRTRDEDGVALVFRGAPRTFIGSVSVDGAKGPTLNAQLERAARLALGTRFTQVKLSQALERMRQTLATNGYHAPKIAQSLTPIPDEQLVDISFHVLDGPRARVGAVEVSGDPGMSVEEFRRHARLRAGSMVDRDTANRAVAGALKKYKQEDRLEAGIKIDSQKFSAQSGKTDYRFTANRGPVVKVLVQGASLSEDRIRRAIPVFEEGAVDEDLLNEGNRRLRDYFQRLGYFDVKVDHTQPISQSGQVKILYNVRLGPRRRVQRVSVEGNRYFDAATLKQLLGVRAADAFDRHGAYSQALLSADVSALQAIYRNNGFSDVKVVPNIQTGQIDEPSGGSASAGPSSYHARRTGKTAPFAVVYRIDEGQQTHVGTVRLEGNDGIDADKLVPLLNTVPGQLLSPQNLAGDRDALTTDYLSRGFDQARVEVTQQSDPADPKKVDVVFHIAAGQQIFVRKALLRGLHYTQPSTVAKTIELHPGDPLNQTALTETQRNLYDLALFSEVDAAVENADGGETDKTVLLQATEARRWALTYGFGFEAQTGTPQNNCASAYAGGLPCNPNGKTGVSPRVLAGITRNNLFGRQQSASLRGTYGLLEQKLDLLFQNPHFEGNRNFGLNFSAGYANSLDVSTYVASKLEGSMRWTERFDTPGSRISRANTLLYELDFRRVKVQASSLQVFPAEIAELATAVRVAGPAFTWIRDTRDSPLDAHRGTYISFQEFLSGAVFGAQAEFNRIDVSNSSYYAFDKGRFVLARNTRYGQERAFGTGGAELIPLPERLYAGGASSLRSFASNSAGPRDPETGFPIGGAGALINSTEMRLPPPTLPWLGNTVSFVLFHDMGNVFTNAGDVWASALRVHQPERENCKDTTLPSTLPPANSTGQQWGCSFNYFSHAPGLGLRYHTPVGPIRLDFSYDLNPPIYPISVNYSQSIIFSDPHVGEAPHFNFFFSLGQTF